MVKRLRVRESEKETQLWQEIKLLLAFHHTFNSLFKKFFIYFFYSKRKCIFSLNEHYIIYKGQ